MAMKRLNENLQCKNPSFFINWLDPLDLSKRKKLLDLCYICPRGTCDGMPYFFFEKSGFVKHTNHQCQHHSDHPDKDHSWALISRSCVGRWQKQVTLEVPHTAWNCKHRYAFQPAATNRRHHHHHHHRHHLFHELLMLGENTSRSIHQSYHPSIS